MSEIKIITQAVAGFYPAILGMRNPMDSWDKSDSSESDNGVFTFGSADMDLAKKLISAGSEHSKFLRQIQVWANVSMPRYWWQEADTYHFGSKNSCSTMHTISKHPFEMDQFYYGKDPSDNLIVGLQLVIDEMNSLMRKYEATKDYKYIIDIKRLLPESYIQMRTWNTNYAEILNIYKQREHHRLKDEWQTVFCGWAKTLPFFKEMCLHEVG